MNRESVEIVGREAELARLAAFINAARDGRGGIVLVSGEAGVGITRLAEEAVARSGFHVLSGRAREDAAPSYAPLVGALRDCIGHGGSVEECGPLAEHLALLLPELGAAPAGADPAVLNEAIAGALIARSRRGPVALVLDDLQWADHATLELLVHLDERLRSEPVAMVATYRSDEITRSHPVRRLRTALRRARRLNEVTVEPLGRVHTAVIVERVIGSAPSPELVDLVQERTQGFPLYVEELAGALVSADALARGEGGTQLSPGERIPVPESVRDAVLIKLDALSGPARSLAEVAAIAGTEFDFDLVSRLAGSEDGLDELLESGLVRELAGGGAFRHALTREAVLDGIRWSRRRALHRNVAAALEGAAPETVARHWLEAGENSAARRALLESARRSCRLHAYRDAAGAVNRALEVWPDTEDEDERIEALELLARCAHIAGQPGDAARALHEVLAAPRVANDDARRAEALRMLATVQQMQGATAGAMESRREAASAFAAAGMTGESAVEWLALASRHTATLMLDAALDAVSRARELAGNAERWETVARALGLEGNLLAMRGEFEAGRERVHEGLSLALEKNLTEAASEVYRRLGSVHEYGSDYAGARDAYATAIDYCRTRGLNEAENTCLGCVSYIVLRTGEWKRALEVCRQIAARDDQPGARAIADGVSGLIRAHRGENRQARQLLQRALETARRFDVAAMELAGLFSMAVVSEYDGDDDAAEEYYRRLMERWAATQERHDIIGWLCWAATFFGRRALERETTRCAEALASIASESASTEAMAGLAYALGETALLQSKPADAVTHFQQSLLQIEKLELPLEHALTQYRLGAALEADGQRDAAVSRMNAAYRITRRMGARALSTRIATTLDGLGEHVEEGRHPSPSARRRRGGLTRRQLEITGLIAEGLTNKEIAHRLYLSPRTVDMHVSNILDRLDCRSRTEAAQKARDLGIID